MRVFKPTYSGMLDELRHDFSQYSNDYSNYQPFNILDDSLSSTTWSGNVWWSGSWYACQAGTILVNGMCLEASSLSLH